MESNDLHFLASHISKFDLGHHQYHILSEFLKSENKRVRQLKELKDAFVSSMYVPENHLKDADNKEYNFSKKQQFLANLNLDMRKNGLDKYIHHITNIFRFDYTNAYALEDDVTFVQQIKDIVKNNIQEIKNETVADEKLIEELNKKIEVFDFKIRNIEIYKQVEQMERTKASRYIQGLQKNCEVYAYIDDLIDAIEDDKKKCDKKIKEEIEVDEK